MRSLPPVGIKPVARVDKATATFLLTSYLDSMAVGWALGVGQDGQLALVRVPRAGRDGRAVLLEQHRLRHRVRGCQFARMLFCWMSFGLMRGVHAGHRDPANRESTL